MKQEAFPIHRGGPDRFGPTVRLGLSGVSILAGFLILCAFTARSVGAVAEIDRPWNREVIYFVLTDRFYDGDPDNNTPPGTDPSVYDPDQDDIDLYHGGDLRGLERAIESGYFNDLGVTALWITPPVRNVRLSRYDSGGRPKTGYHGYWAQDFLDIDPQLTSRTSLNGKRTYPDNRDGRMEHYRDFVQLAHRHGIRIIQDIVLNHAGPVFFYDLDGDNQPYRGSDREWIIPFQDTPNSTATWIERPGINLKPTEPDGPVTILGHGIDTTGILAETETYGRRGMSAGSLAATDGEELLCDFISLRDLDTRPDSPHFDELVDEFVEIYAFYLEVIGVDGFRIDTVKHVHHEFWDAFTERLRKRIGPERAAQLFITGEVYDGNPRVLGKYTYRSDWPENTSPGMDSVLDFQLCYAVRDYLRQPDGQPGNPAGLQKSLASRLSIIPETNPDNRPWYQQNPGPDGLAPADKLLNFTENHDGINRFRVRGVSAEHNRLANALMLTLPGIPCLYYGTETDLRDGEGTIGPNTETGRLTFLPADQSKPFAEARKNPAFQQISALTEIRRRFPALAAGDVHPLWSDSPDSADDDGIFAFACTHPEFETMVVVVNASGRSATAGLRDNPMPLTDRYGQPLLDGGEILIPVFPEEDPDGSRIPQWENGLPAVVLPVPAHEIRIFRIGRSVGRETTGAGSLEKDSFDSSICADSNPGSLSFVGPGLVPAPSHGSGKRFRLDSSHRGADARSGPTIHANEPC